MHPALRPATAASTATTTACAALALLAACTSAPRPPDVDESRKRPANTGTAVSLQMCQNDLHNTRLAAAETVVREEAARASADRLLLQNQVLALAARTAPSAESVPGAPAQAAASTAQRPPGANRIYTLTFGYASTRVDINPSLAQLLVSHALAAPLVLLRGRTDGLQDNLTDNHIARQRAQAVREYLVAAGVDASRIRTTHQPSGDHAADNTLPAGRASNRRVEVEIYSAAPVHMARTTSATASAALDQAMLPVRPATP